MVLDTELNYSDDEFLDEAEDGDEEARAGAAPDGPSVYDQEALAALNKPRGDEEEEDWEEEEMEEEEESSRSRSQRECSNKCECTAKGPDVTARQRLALVTKTSIDRLRDTIPKPCDSIPRTYLPAWPGMPLMSKLPRVPAPPGTIIYSRGTLGKSLLRSHKHYTLLDPWHMMRVPEVHYDALHDVHANGYLMKPMTREILIRQGLLTPANEVLCSQREFNRFRIYLSTLHNAQLESAIADCDRRWASDRETIQRIMKYQSQTEAAGKDRQRQLKIENAARKNAMKHQMVINKFKEKEANDAVRECHYYQEKQRQIINRKIVGMEKDRIVAQRRCRLREKQLEKRRQTLHSISMKDIAVEERVRNEKCVLKRAYNQFLLEWLDAKYQFQAEDVPKKEEIQKRMEHFAKRKAERRQVRVEKYREMLPELIEQRKAKEARVWVIVKRLFYKWLKKVRERKARKPDALHQSLWDGPQVLEDTLKYLRTESGYEKLDDFILNILRLKEEIKLRLAEEEAEEERQRLLAEAEEEEEEEGAETESTALPLSTLTGDTDQPKAGSGTTNTGPTSSTQETARDAPPPSQPQGEKPPEEKSPEE